MKRTKLIAILLDSILWMSAVVFSLGGIEIGGRLRLTYINDWWCACAVVYIVSRMFFGVRLSDTSFGRAFVRMSDTAITAIRNRTLQPLKTLEAPSWALLLLSVYAISLFIFLPVFTFWGLGNNIFDLGIIDNAIYNGAKTGTFSTRFLTLTDGSPIEYFPHNRLNFGLFFFALIYKISDRTEYLLLLQSLFLLAALVPIYKLGDLILPRGVPRWLPLLLYVFWDPIHRMNTWDFHETPFMIPFAFWAFYYLERRKLGWAFLHMTLMALWREDAWPTFSAMSVYAGIRTGRWRVAIPAAVASAAVLPLFTHFFNIVNAVGHRYHYLGPDLPSAVRTVIHKPWIFFQVMMEPDNFQFFVRLLIRGGVGIFLFSGWSIIPALPGIMEIGLSEHGAMLSFLNHYVGLFTAPLIYAVLRGIARVQPWLEQKRGGLGDTAIACIAAISFSQLSFSETGAMRMAIGNFKQTRCLAELEEMVPKDVPVIANSPVATHLSHRPWIAHLDSGARFSEATWMIVHEGAIPVLGKANDKSRPWKILANKCGWVVATRAVAN